jgi:hypothetical protein
MKDLLSLLNGTICLRASFSYDEKGFVRPETRVVLFGQSPLAHPSGVCDPGTGHFLSGSSSYVAVLFQNVIELVLVKLRVVARPPARPLRLIKEVADARRFSDTKGNLNPYLHCVTWSDQDLEPRLDEIFLKCSTNKTPPPLAPRVVFPVPSNRFGKAQGACGIFQLGQVVSIKLSAQAASHDPEHLGIVISSDDEWYSLVYDLAVDEVEMIPHNQVYTPTFLAPPGKMEAIERKEDLLAAVQSEIEAEGPIVRLPASPARFPPLQAPAAPDNGVCGIAGGEERIDSPVSTISSLGSDQGDETNT